MSNKAIHPYTKQYTLHRSITNNSFPGRILTSAQKRVNEALHRKCAKSSKMRNLKRIITA